jgi:aryl-alcohol dehydrogenase-like predicted oxidoreductase
MKLALGTAQFGQPYGVANTLGQVSSGEIKSILRYCEASSISTIDTAIDYGSSEASLGKAGVNGFDVISKIPAIPMQCFDIDNWVNKQIEICLNRLKVKKLYGLLLHRPEQLLEPFGPKILQALVDLKVSGVVKKIGISIYDPAELEYFYNFYDFDIVQTPFNLIDRRLISSGWLEKLKAKNVEVHCRSCFLQGLLVMPKSEIPRKFDHWDDLFSKWHDWLLNNNNISAAEVCIAFVNSFYDIDKIVVGIDSQIQLEHLVTSLTRNIKIDTFPDISSDDKFLINPPMWSKL